MKSYFAFLSTILQWHLFLILVEVAQGSLGSTKDIKWKEYTVPRVLQANGSIDEYIIPPKPDNPFLGSQSYKSPDKLSLLLDWRNQTLSLELYKTDLVSPGAIVEWEEGNYTFQGRVREDCFYHGYVMGHEESFVGLSTCLGLNGFIHTDEEELTLEPAATDQQKNRHVITTTTNRQKRAHLKKRNHGRRVRRSPESFRKKRSTGDVKYLEVMLACDSTVVKFHGKDKYEQYLLGMLNVMNMAYQHGTLGVDIRVVLVRLKVMDDATARPMVRRNNHIALTLQLFCRWASSLQNRYDPNDPSNHDIAIYVTRKDIGPAGYAPVTGLCYPTRSCAIIKDEGLSSGFVMAHETAHTFGLLHDGQGNSCHGPSYHGSIMAPLMESAFNRYFWTECSRVQMTGRIRGITCLDDKPGEQKWEKLPDPMGKIWSLDEQCRQEFGEQFSLCEAYHHRDQCPMLWCSEKRRPLLCKTKGGPPLEGTKCGDLQYCVSGRCQYEDDVIPEDGNWSSWGDWGHCSTPCGIGIKYRHRRCDNPAPAFGGKSCEGNFEQYRTCNLDVPCGIGRDLRADMCNNFNFGIPEDKQHNWMPYQQDDVSSYCKVACVSEQTGDILKTDGDVIDGIRCTYEDAGNICVRGRCRRVGCDGKIRSKKSFDACGVCGGKSTSCHMVKDLYKTPKKKVYGSYEQVTTLPTGARDIKITETVKSADDIVVKDIRNDKVYVNKKNRPDNSKQFVVNGARFVYTRRGYEESLKSAGPLNNDFEILLYVTDTYRPTAVSFQYTVANAEQSTQHSTSQSTTHSTTQSTTQSTRLAEATTIGDMNEDEDEDEVMDTSDEDFGDNRTDDDEYSEEEGLSNESGKGQQEAPWTPTRDVAWIFDRWSECSQTCGGGTFYAIFACKDFDLNSTVEDSVCSHLETPEVPSAPCNRKSCFTYKWELGPWQNCSVECGYGGEEKQGLVCQKVSPDGGEEEVDATECNRVKKPGNLTRPCQLLVPCTGTWVKSAWSRCSTTCGTGVQTRRVNCEYYEPTEYFSCDGVPPSTTQTCEQSPCRKIQTGQCTDSSKMCRTRTTARLCQLRGFRKLCCQACKKYNTSKRRRFAY
ncbi:A disintegrin and metalloproteinase with thrombospondin motifs 14-like isoform X2 [Liolophura sinensis]|uniref:A disintegrin and metalloproteinase with thrombospondin motifs 14-like isoform X2 n=1 Tax=Liolophura sinensis TaxID=3198878 RepID=UPI0031590CC3